MDMDLKYLIEKEFKQIRRNSFIPKLMVMFPCLMLLVLPWAVNLEIKNINVSFVDNDHSVISARLMQKIQVSDYFNLAGVSGSYLQALQQVEEGEADMIVEIPARFERDWMNGAAPQVAIAVNAVNGMKGGLGSSYMTNLVNEFADELREETGRSGNIASLLVPQNRFNIHLNYKLFMVPGLMVILLTMLCGFLPALNIVGEKEKGTIEQLNVTPVRKFSFILAKLIPYWIVGFVVLSISILLAYLVYGLVPVGSLLIVYLFAGLFMLMMSGLGLVVSNYSTTMQQAMLVMYFFVIIMLLMSGLFTPINSMPAWAQDITIFNPLKYFIQVMRGVYMKGTVLGDLGYQFLALVVFAVFFNLWAVFSYRKSA